jgi:opacity protein-like surface antigen
MYVSKLSRSFALLFIIVIFSSIFAQAQNSSNSTVKATRNSRIESAAVAAQPTEYSTKPNEIGFWGGTSTVHKDLRGESAGGNFQMAGFRYSHRLLDGKSVKLRYILDLIPVAVLNYPRNLPYRTAQNTTQIVHDRKTVYGLGFAPGGLQLNFRNRKKFQPFIGGGLGFMYFTHVTPDFRTPLQPRETGAKINYTADVGAGLEIGLKKNRNFIVGYKYHHLSNLYTGNINIGYNSNFVYAGMNFGY